MITKFKSIKNLAVFKDFDWDTAVVDKDNSVYEFKEINIIYGRNYSGKTTLSRIVRALETDHISDKYENPEFCIEIKNDADINHSGLTAHNKTIRVFNEDFIKSNLKFIINSDENIQPFAILGGDNNIIEEEIKNLEEKLGSNDEGEETKLYKDLKSLDALYQSAKTSYSNAVSALDSQISSKALDRSNGIKYQSEKFGDQNYTTNKLKAEIGIVSKKDYKSLSDEKKKQAEEILLEKKKELINELPNLSLKFDEYAVSTEELVTIKIGRADKIEELVKNAVLNRWVKDGKELHKGKRKVCAFCNNQINDERWHELDKHFDEESDKLEKDISNLLTQIAKRKENINETTGYKKEDFYSEFHVDLEQLTEEYSTVITNYNNSLVLLEDQLNIRKEDLLNEKQFSKPDDFSEQIDSLKTKFDELRKKSDDYSAELGTKQSEAKKSLRLKEVYDFTQNINYAEQLSNIEELKTIEEDVEKNKRDKQHEIDNIIAQIEAKQKELKDESKGADKVNEYLNDFFGHDFLTLKAIEYDDEAGDKRYRFEIQRGTKKAHHLSEGECSLIAFCYFMAKLQDVNTKLKKPIIWIDDPVSSLDSNHIFFIYTLINTKIFGEKDFEQLFISTHSLEFLKFLKRLPGANTTKETKTNYRYLIVERIGSDSSIKIMPDFLRKYVTEFNYLFSQIYKCAQLESVDDSNYTLFYNFGNNARKFLEIFLYYKYPDSTGQLEKMKMFFGNDDIPAVLTERINNEYSHLLGVFERGATVVEVPEMNKTAKLIISKLMCDAEQYNAFLRSIGVENEIPEEKTETSKVETKIESEEEKLNSIQLETLASKMNSPCSKSRLRKDIGIRDYKIFDEEYFDPALEAGIIKQAGKKKKTIQFALTNKGKEFKTEIIG